MAFLDGGQRHATVATHGRVKAMRLNYEKLGPLLEKSPALKGVLAPSTASTARRTAPQQEQQN